MKTMKDKAEVEMVIRVASACLGAAAHVLQARGITTFREGITKRLQTPDEVCRIWVDIGEAVIQTLTNMLPPPTE